MPKTIKTVSDYFNQDLTWNAELSKLREFVMSCGLEETLKWNQPTYLINGKNVLILHAFKDYCGIGFFKGALLQDNERILKKPGENTQAGRQLRFTSMQEIVSNQQIIKAYIFEAIELEKAGMKVERSATPIVNMPEEFQSKLDEAPALKKAFEALTPGRQRAYLMFFNDAKQSATRTARIEKLIPKILIGKGMTDCTCGLSKRMPACDGSHRQLK